MSVWDAVIGQDERIAPLVAAVSDPAAMTHAWLVTGPPGSGRSIAARAFAAALECPGGGCGECRECETVLAGTHGDVTVMATENVQISVAQVRELVTVAARGPSVGRWRVIVVEDADRMTERTSNVLLKAIEEPAERTVWVLCAPSPRDVIVTIRSRCRPVSLRIPPVAAVARLLVERDGVAPEAARAAAMAAQCHIGVARRLAMDEGARARREQVLAIPAQAASVGQAVIAAGELVEIAQAEAKAVGEHRDAAERRALLRANGVDPDADNAEKTAPPYVRAQLKQFDGDAKRRSTRHQRDVLDRALIDLLSFYRDVLALQTGAGVALVNTSHEDDAARIAETSAMPSTLRRIAHIEEARQRLAGNVQPALALEAMAVGLALGDG